MKRVLLLLTAALILSGLKSYAQRAGGFHLLDSFHIKSSGGWDYLEVGPVNDWLYVSHGTQVNILNKKTGDSVGIIENTIGVHGIAFDVSNSKGFVSNGRLNTVTVFDMQTNKVLAQVKTGQNPDAIIYESYSKKIITCNGRSKNLSIIDPVQNTTVDSVDIGGKPETPVSDGSGRIYVNIEDKNEIAVVDMKTLRVINRWSIAPGDGPTGLAIDKLSKRLFAGCDKLLLVVDAVTGSVIDKISIGDGCDGVAFDPELKNIYASNGDGTLTVIHEDAPDKYTVVENVPTKRGARTIALDKTSHLIYLPTATFETLQPGEKRPRTKAGSFEVLVVGK